jgi:hypothetical protein
MVGSHRSGIQWITKTSEKVIPENILSRAHFLPVSQTEAVSNCAVDVTVPGKLCKRYRYHCFTMTLFITNEYYFTIRV